MEHSVIAACVALLLGCTIQDNYRYTNVVRNSLPNQSFEPLVEVLQKLRDFAYLAVSHVMLLYCINVCFVYYLGYNDQKGKGKGRQNHSSLQIVLTLDNCINVLINSQNIIFYN